MARRSVNFSIHKLSYKTLFIVVFLLLIAIVSLLKFIPNQKISAAWWNDGWNYRVAVNIGNTGASLSNYQVAVSIGTSALVNAGKMKSNCDDIRVTDQNGNVLNYWLSGCNTDNTQVWPKIPSIPVGGATIYIYYGNSSAAPGKTKVGTSDYPGLSCKSILDAGDSSGTGNYWIDPTNGNTSDKFQAYCDMTNDSGGWMMVTQSMINSEVGTSVTTTKTTNANGGVNFSTIPNSGGCGAGPNSVYKVYFNNVIPWTKIKADYTFLGGNSCWAIFGHNGYGADTNLIQFASATDTIRNQIKMGGSAGDNYDGVNNRCEDTTTNFWHTSQGVGTTRSAQVILRRNSMSSLAGLGTGVSCTTIGYPWKYQNIYIREDNMTFAVAASSPNTEEVGGGPVAHWKFDEGVGTTAYDSTSNKNNGVLGTGTSIPTWQNEDQCLNGKCLYFNGATNYVDFGNNQNLQIETGNFTVETWFKSTISKCGAEIIDKGKNILCGGATYGGWSLGQNNGRTIFRISDSVTDNNASVTDSVTRVNEWVHAVGVRNGDTISLYINGKFVGSQTQSNINIDTDVTLRVGGHTTVAWNAKGFIDNVKIYRYARTAAQIKADYAAGKFHTSSTKGTSANLGGNKNSGEFLSDGLVSYWKTDETSGAFLDYSGTGSTAPVLGSNNYSQGKFGGGLRSGIGTTNYVTNPSFETSTNTWNYQVAAAGSSTNTTTKSLFGNYSLMITRSAGSSEANVYNNLSGLQANTVYYYSAWAWASTSSTACVYTYNGTTNLSQICHSGSSKWERIGGTFTSSATGTIQLRLGHSSYTNLGSVYFDGAQVELGTTPTAYLDGSLGTGYTWNGTAHASTSVRTDSSATTPLLNDTSGTISFWFNSPSLDQYSQCPFGSSSGNSTGGIFLGLQSTGVSLLHVYAAGTSLATSATTTFNNNTWNNLSYSWDNSTRIGNLYINGQKQKTVFYTQAISIGEYIQNLGTCSKTGLTSFNGSLDEVRIYNRALSSTEISQLYNWAPGPIAYWNLNENTGTTANDSSGNNNNGLITGSTWTQGKFGGGLKFSTTNDYVYMPTLNNFSGSGTVSMWVKWTGSGYDYLFDHNEHGFLAFTNDTGINFFPNYGGDSNDSLVINNINWDQNWHFVTLTADDSTNLLQIYFDGILKGSSSPDWSAATVNNFTIGAISSYRALYNFNGSLDDIKIYNYVRTQKQIVEDMNAGHPAGGSPVGSQLAYYKFDEGFGTTVSNWGNGGSSLNGSLGAGSSAPSWSNDGKFGKALSFNGAGNYVSIPALSNITQTSWTVWIKPTSTNSMHIIKSNGASDYMIANVSGKAFRIRTFSGSGDIYTNSGLLPTNSWSQLAMVYTNPGIKIYLNGKLENQNGTYTLGNLNSTYQLGKYGGAEPDFSGLMDEVKIYNYALTDDEIKIDYNRNSAMQMGGLSSGTGNTAPATAASQEYCIPGDNSVCSSPTAEWKFNEGSGSNPKDTSGHNYDLIFNGSPTWTSGKIGSALNFSNNNYVITKDWDIDLQSPFTLEAWVYCTNVNNTSTIIGKASGTSDTNYWMDIRSGGQVYFGGYGLSGEGLYVYTSGTPIINNHWYHIVGVDTGLSRDIYINGIKQTVEGTLQGTLVQNDMDVSIGNRIPNGESNPFNGKIDNVIIYDYARTPAQIAWDYNKGGPVGWWKMDECQGNTAYDWSGIGINGAINIGPSGSQNTLGTCAIGTSAAWTNGASGKFNSSLSFDGTDDSMTISQPTIPSTPNTFTISGYINPENQSGYIITPQSNGIDQYLAYESGNQRLNVHVAESSDTNERSRYSTTGSVPINKWTHFAISINNLNIKIYINGKLNAEYTEAINIAGWTGSWAIAQRGNSTNWLKGKLDDLRVYNYILTPAQIKTIYNNGAVNFSN